MIAGEGICRSGKKEKQKVEQVYMWEGGHRIPEKKKGDMV